MVILYYIMSCLVLIVIHCSKQEHPVWGSLISQSHPTISPILFHPFSTNASTFLSLLSVPLMQTKHHLSQIVYRFYKVMFLFAKVHSKSYGLVYIVYHKIVPHYITMLLCREFWSQCRVVSVMTFYHLLCQVSSSMWHPSLRGQTIN